MSLHMSTCRTLYSITEKVNHIPLYTKANKGFLQTHNPKVRGSNPLPATKYIKDLQHFVVSPFFMLGVTLVLLLFVPEIKPQATSASCSEELSQLLIIALPLFCVARLIHEW